MAIFQKTNFPGRCCGKRDRHTRSMDGFGFAQWARSVRPELKILLAGTPERAVRNAAEPCEVGPTLKVRCRLHGGASGSGGPPGERNVANTVTASGPRARLQNGKNSAHC